MYQAVDILGLDPRRKILETMRIIIVLFSVSEIIIQEPTVYNCPLPTPKSSGNGAPNYGFIPASQMILKHTKVSHNS